MQNRILFAMLMLIASFVSVQAQTSPPPPVIIPVGGQKPRSLTESPEVKACYTSDTLTVSITGYYGDVEVTIEEAVSGTVQTTQTEYVSWQAVLATDIHGLAVGNYVLYIRLDNDDEYVGYFSK